MKATKIIIRNCSLFPGVLHGVPAEILPQAEVHIEDGIFSYVGPAKEAPPWQADQVLDAGGKLLMPPFCNAHTHNAMTILRGAGSGLALKNWLFDCIFPLEKKLTPQISRIGVQLALLEHLSSGVSAVNDMYMFPEEEAEAIGEAGMRALITNACVEFGKGEEQLKEALEFHRRYHLAFDGRIRAGVSIHAEYTSTPALIKALVEASSGLDNVVHVHVSETGKEVRECFARWGKSPVTYLHDSGLFSMPTIAAHCVVVDQNDIEILARDGVTVAHNPISNLKLGSGFAPVEKMLKSGVRVALGTDGAASNDNLDLFEEIKLMALLPKGRRRSPKLISPAEVLEAASRNGIRAMGFSKLGYIARGYEADTILMDLDLPNTCAYSDVLSALVYAAQSRNLVWTMVQGRLLYYKGEYLSLDRDRILYEAAAAAQALHKA